MSRSPVLRATRVVGGLTAAAALVGSNAPGRAAQVPPVTPPMIQGESVSIGADLDRYRALWGAPEFRALDDENAKPWPRLKNIRTVGTFNGIPGKGPDAGPPPQLGMLLEFDSVYTSYMVCGQTRCLAIMPVFEMRDAFSNAAVAWQQQDVEIIGAFDNAAMPMPQSRGIYNPPPTWAFHVWSIGPASAGSGARPQSHAPTLESLVRGPEAAAGRVVTVTGVFRGADLFDDLPPETRRLPSDWVLRDGAFSIWVTGREPKGSGWALDARSRGDCRHRLEVRGRVETAGGYVYLRAKELRLLGPVRDDDGEPPRPRQSRSAVPMPDR